MLDQKNNLRLRNLIHETIRERLTLDVDTGKYGTWFYLSDVERKLMENDIFNLLEREINEHTG